MTTPSAKVTVASLGLMIAGCGMIVLGGAEISWLHLTEHVRTELQASGVQSIGIGLGFLGLGRLLVGIKDDLKQNTELTAGMQTDLQTASTNASVAATRAEEAVVRAEAALPPPAPEPCPQSPSASPKDPVERAIAVIDRTPPISPTPPPTKETQDAGEY